MGGGQDTRLARRPSGPEERAVGLLVTSTATKASASAAGHESGAPWMNLTALTESIVSGRPVRARVIVVDEASMADVRSLVCIADHCAGDGRAAFAA